MPLNPQPSTLNSSAAATPLLTLEHLHAFAAWLAHGPGTARAVAGKSDIPLIELRPRTEELLAVGGVRIIGQATEGPIYTALPNEINAPSATDEAQRQLNTLPIQDQVSIAAGIMARHGRRGRTAAHWDRQQTELL